MLTREQADLHYGVYEGRNEPDGFKIIYQFFLK